MPIAAAKRRAAAQKELAYNEFTEDRIVEAKFVDGVRHEIYKWRFERRPGVTATTRKLEHWTDPDRERRLYFCKVETLETVIWLTEVAPKQGTGRHILNEL